MHPDRSQHQPYHKAPPRPVIRPRPITRPAPSQGPPSHKAPLRLPSRRRRPKQSGRPAGAGADAPAITARGCAAGTVSTGLWLPGSGESPNQTQELVTAAAPCQSAIPSLRCY